MSIRKKINGNFQVIATDGMTHITWSALKTLRDGGKLIPGMFYRITDYITTTIQGDTRSAGHAFDVIVRADSANVLNENATAALHSGDTYFEGQKLESWKLKYCLDNDTDRFAWADTTNGKGVIYQMIDERGNDLPYDFKNIQFKRYKVTKYLVGESKWGASVATLNSDIASSPSLRWGCITTNDSAVYVRDTWWADKSAPVHFDGSVIGWLKVEHDYDMFVLSDDTEKWFYTFSKLISDSEEVTDSSLFTSVHNNKFGHGPLINNIPNLGNNVFIGYSIYDNIIGGGFRNNTIGNNFNSNTIGNNFNSNTIDNNFNNNTIGNNFNSNTIGKDFFSNVLDDDCYENIIGKTFCKNTIFYGFKCNTINQDFDENTIGNYFHNNIIDQMFDDNTISNSFSNNIIDSGFAGNTIDNYFGSNTISNHFDHNTIGDQFYRNTIGSFFSNNTVGNSFTNSTIGKFYKWNHFEDGCSKLKFEVNGTGSSQVQKYRVLTGTAPSSSTVVNVTAGNNAPMNVKLSADGNSVSVVAA